MKRGARLETPGGGYAKARPGVVAAALAMIALLAAAVCLLHGENAVALRGTVRVGDCEIVEEGVSRYAALAEGDVRALSLAQDARFATCVERLEERGGLLHISGVLLRLAEPTLEVRVRVALIPGRDDGEAGTGGALSPSDEGILLNTQMCRRGELAKAHALDDHCGFEAAVRLDELGEGVPYRIVLVEQTDAGARLFETNCWALCGRDGVRPGYEQDAREEGQEDE